MLKNLIEIVTNVKGAADQVLSGSDEISASAQRISQGSTETGFKRRRGFIFHRRDEFHNKSEY